jgi:uncharacterized protein with von Willebrand factor type A (vWA) domain
MTDRELMRQALDALMAADPDDMVFDAEGHMVFRKDVAINALRDRLAQPERYGSEHYRDMYLKVRDELAALQQRQWVGLTIEEIKSLPSWWPSYEDAPALIELVKDVEAKLREKNEIRHP